MARVDVQAGKVSISQMIKALYVMLRGVESIPLQGKRNSQWLGRPLQVECGNGLLEAERSIRRLFYYILGQKIMRVYINEDMAVNI